MLTSLIAMIGLAHGAAYDPNLTWRTLKTEHFNIHFHGGEEQLAEEMAHTVEMVFDKMTQEMDWEPEGKTELVLVDNTDSANGYATYLPRNTIVIFVTAPQGLSTLSLYEDWNDAIFTHEYTHILHMDTVGGLPAIARKIFGRIISINGLAPGWVIEGQATLQETRHTNAGRGRASIPDMFKRTSVLTNSFPPLDTLDGYQSLWPSGNLRYIWGQDFMQFVSDKKGRDVWTNWNHAYGSGIPYALPDKHALGDWLPNLYKAWKSEATQRYQKQIQQINAIEKTNYDWVTDPAENCMGPRQSPDGSKVVYSCVHPNTGANIYLADGHGGNPKVEIKGVFATDFSWRQDSSAFVYSGRRRVNRFNMYSDIYMRNIGKGTSTLTRGKRARDPVFSKNGNELLYVTNKVQNNQLTTLRIDQTDKQLTNHKDHTQYADIEYSPDGRHILVSKWSQGGMDLWILDAKGTPIRRLTQDQALDGQAVWSSNGERIYFSSDRSGVFNVYAIDLPTEKIYQVTNVETGAFWPSPSPHQEQLIFGMYHQRGYGVAKMDLDESKWIDRGRIPSPFSFNAPTSKTLPKAPIQLPPKYVPNPPKESSSSNKTKQKPRPLQGKETKKLDTEQLYLPGLTGIGGPFAQANIMGGFWGLPFEEQHWGDATPTSGPNIQEESNIDAEQKDEEEFSFSYPVKRYNSLDTLFPPTFITPGIFRSAYGFLFNLGTATTDTLREHILGANINWRTASGQIGWGLSYALNKYIPIYSFGVYSYTVPYSSVYTYETPEAGAWIPSIVKTDDRYWDRRIRAYAQMSYSINANRSVFARWTGSHRMPWISNEGFSILDYPFTFGNKGLPANAYRPFLPNRGFLSSIGGGWRYSRGLSFRRSISPEEARLVSIVGELHHPYFGSFILDDNDEYIPFTQLQLTGEWREYKTLPWGQNHVLAIKAAGGASAGDVQRYGSFRLGGSFGESGYYTLPDEWRSLRGYSPAARDGNSYYLASLEYRMPLFWVDRGFHWAPLFFRNVSASAFVDVGNAFDEFTDVSTIPMLGIGAELRARMILSWGQALSLRGGYAFSPLGDGFELGSIDGFYLWVGSSF